MPQKFFFIVSLFLSTIICSAQKTPKIAVVNYDSILQQLPEHKIGTVMLKILKKNLENKMNVKITIFEMLIKEASKCYAYQNLDSLQKLEKGTKLKQLQKDIQDFEVLAIKEFEQKTKNLADVCRKKIVELISIVALREGYDLVFCSYKADKKILFYIPNDDITNLVILAIY